MDWNYCRTFANQILENSGTRTQQGREITLPYGFYLFLFYNNIKIVIWEGSEWNKHREAMC